MLRCKHQKQIGGLIMNKFIDEDYRKYNAEQLQKSVAELKAKTEKGEMDLEEYRIRIKALFQITLENMLGIKIEGAIA